MDSPISTAQSLDPKSPSISTVQNNNVWVLGICFGLLTLVIIKQMQERKKAKEYRRSLKSLEEKLAKQHLKIAAFEKLIETQQLERDLLSKELHDEIGGLVASVKLHINQLFDSEQEVDSLKLTLNEILENTSARIRKTAASIMPHSLSHFGIQEAINDLASEFSNSTLSIQTHFDGIEKLSLKGHHAWMLYKMLYELIESIAHKNEANRIFIQLSYVDDMLILTMDDDGARSISLEEQESYWPTYFHGSKYFGGLIDSVQSSGEGNSISFHYRPT